MRNHSFYLTLIGFFFVGLSCCAVDNPINDAAYAAYKARLDQPTSNVLRDLEVFSVQGRLESGAFFKAIDRTVTSVGQKKLQDKLKRLKTSIPELKKEQELTKVLLADEQALRFLDTTMRGLKGDVTAKATETLDFCDYEPSGLTDQNKEKVYTKNAFNERYTANSLLLPASFKKAWKESPRSMQAEVYWKEYWPYISLALGLLCSINNLTGSVKNLEVSRSNISKESLKRWKSEYVELAKKDSLSWFEHQKYDWVKVISEYSQKRDISEDDKLDLQDAVLHLTYLEGPGNFLRSMYVSNLMIPGEEAVYRDAAATFAGDIFQRTQEVGMVPFSLYALYNSKKNSKTIAQDLASRVQSVGKLISTAHKVYEYGKTNKTFADAFPGYSELEVFFNRKLSITKQLQDTIAADGSSKKLLKGTVLACYAMLEDTTKKIKKVLQAIGDLDASLSVAKLIKESETTSVKYSFAEYVDRDTPHVRLEDFWHPVIDPHVAVPNSLQLGGHKNPSTMVITGPNTGGKSTVLKGAIASLWLAQTLGIAPSRHAQITPFTMIDSSMNIVDNAAQGVSLYQAEVDRAASLHAQLESLEHKDKKFGIVVFDEMFCGTDPDQAALATADCTEQLAARSNSLALVATHFKNPVIELEEKMQGACKNFKVDIDINKDGTLKRGRKLEPGVSSTHVARLLLQETMAKHAAGKKQ